MLNKNLYLFPHLPKTGGAALFQNVERFLPRSACLRLNCTHKQYYFDPKTKELRFYEKEQDFLDLLASLTEEQKREISFASGHDLPYGLHRHFPQKARYFLFVRHPISRVLSLYNYQRTQHEILKKMHPKDESHQRLEQFSKQWFLKGGKVPSFEEWVETSYEGLYPFYFTMTHSLRHLGYLDNDDWDGLFEKFFFVGLTETLDEDELYLYHEMGIRRFWADRNTSYPYHSWSAVSLVLRQKILEKHEQDLILYEKAKQVREQFVKTHPRFKQKVLQMRIHKQLAFFPERVVPPLKQFLRPVKILLKKAYAARR